MKEFAAQGDAPGLKWQHIAAATIGNALEFYDFLTYAFFSIQIGHAFFPAQSAYGSLMLSLATFGAGFVTRPIGAFVIGNYSDRVGRKPAMMLCFVLIGCAIVGMALTPTYARIGIAAPILAVIARMIQGFSLGGEIGSNTAFLLEAAPVEKRGLIVSWQGASQNLALIAGGLVGVLLTALLPAARARYLRLAHCVSTRGSGGAVRILATLQPSGDTPCARDNRSRRSRTNPAGSKRTPIGASSFYL